MVSVQKRLQVDNIRVGCAHEADFQVIESVIYETSKYFILVKMPMILSLLRSCQEGEGTVLTRRCTDNEIFGCILAYIGWYILSTN